MQSLSNVTYDEKPIECPFCGETSEVFEESDMCLVINDADDTETEESLTFYGVRCTDSDCIGHDIDPCYAELENAIKAWNRRVEK